MLVDSQTFQRRVEMNGRSYVVDVPYNRRIKCKCNGCVFLCH